MMSSPGRHVYLLCISLTKKLNVVKPPFALTRHFNALTSIRQTISPALIIGRLPAHYSTSTNFHCPPAEMEVPGVPLSGMVQILESFAPTTLAEKWDNVGLLIAPEEGTERLISKVLLTNDLSEDVLKEAVTGNFHMIISYHPPIFEAVKRVTSSTWKGRILQTCLRRSIAVYSPHTSWDAAQGGVNDWLIQAFDAFKPTSKPIFQMFEPNKLATHLAEAIVPKETSSHLISRIRGTLKVENIGQIPYQMENDNVVKISIPCKQKDIVSLSDVLQGFPHQFLQHQENPVLNYGMGRLSNLGLPQKLKEMVEVVKKHLDIPDVSLALARGANMDTLITTVAVCAGSGGSVLQGQNVDLLVTGEMSHHQVLDAVHQGASVILTRHSNSERGFLKHFLSVYLNKHLAGKVNFAISSKDQDPLHTV